MNKLQQILENALKSEPAFLESESGELNYIKVKDSADKIDEKLISLLADNEDLKNKFFTKIKDVYVFKTRDFKFFLDESKIDNSYTSYANRIGIADNSGLLENRSEVVLDFPFKDCVLEGGQSTEEGTDTYFEFSDKTGKYEEKNGKRNEIFFNQVLAHDEIDRLYDKKALVNWKRFTKNGEIPLFEGWTAKQDGVEKMEWTAKQDGVEKMEWTAKQDGVEKMGWTAKQDGVEKMEWTAKQDGVEKMEWTAKQDGMEKIPEWQQKSLFQFWLLPKNKELNQRAKELRKQGILSEVLFWKNFKNKEKLKGYDIDRQIIIGNFIVDFFIAELGLVIEIDGASHDDKQEYDQERQEFLEDLGLKVIRYTDKEVKQNIEGIYQDFLKNIENREKELSTYPPRQSTIDTPQRGEFSTHYPFKRGIDGTIKENLIIKGNNLLALHSLKSEFAGKVKLIYIDPPYNTGSDGFRYNDNFNHSTWLTFMKNRLDVAKELLRDDGVIFVQCDDNEQAYLKVLMDEIQDIQFINCITVKMNESKGLKNAHIEKRLPKSKEYVLVYSKNKFIFNPQKIEKNKEELKGYVKYYNKQILNINEDMSLWKIGDFSESIEERLLNAEKLIYLVEPDNDIKLYLKKNSFGRIVNSKGNANYYYNNGKDILKVLFLSQNLNRFIGDLWTDISTININKEGGIPVLSNGQKPEKIIQRIIDLATNTSDIVLDYHLGSGTTCAVAHKMNRQYIGIEQMDYIETIAVERIKNATQGEQGGISKAVGWQGGGEFIYYELAKWNEKAKEEIQNAKDLPGLVELFDTLYEKYFLNYNVKIKDFKEKIVKEEGFKKLALAQQKKMFLTMLDLNQMYVQESEMADERYGISTEDQKLTKAFYSKK